jgi:hypothetical protein
VPQSHAPVAEFTRQIWFAGQMPPQTGAELAVHATGMSWQPHSVDPRICLQAWLAGHGPPHCGAVLCAHCVTMF